MTRAKKPIGRALSPPKKSDEAAAYEATTVTAVLAYLATDSDLLTKYRSSVAAEYFESPEERWVVRQIIEHYDAHGVAPGLKLLRLRQRGMEPTTSASKESKQLVGAVLDSAEDLLTDAALRQFVDSKLGRFLRRGAVKAGIIRAAEQFDEGDEEDALATIDEARLVGLEAEDLRWADSIDPVRVRWVWKNHWPAKRLTLLVGDPSTGKSILTCDLAARLSRASEWPDGKPIKRPSSILIVSAEDRADDTIAPRLIAAGADMKRIVAVGVEGNFTDYQLPEGAAVLERSIKEMKETRGGRVTVFLDPLEVFLPKTRMDSHKSMEVRQAISPLDGVAARTGAAIVGVMHLNKRSTEANPLYRVSGSIAFTAFARAVLQVALEPDGEGGRSFVVVKGNLGKTPPVLRFRVTGKEAGQIKWLGLSDLSPSEALSTASTGPKKDTQQAMVYRWLVDFLADGPKPMKEVEETAKAEGFSVGTLNKVKVNNREQLLSVRIGGKHGVWMWKLADVKVREREPGED